MAKKQSKPSTQPSSKSPQERKNTKPRLAQRLRKKILTSYYSNPAKDLKIIAVTGASGRQTVGHFLQECIKQNDEKAGLILDPVTTGDLYRQLSKHWRLGANHVVITITDDALAKHLFYQLPVYAAVNTDTGTEDISGSILSQNPSNSVAKTILYNLEPHFNIISRDHPDYNELANYPVKTATMSYGHSRDADLRINRFKLYKLGTEATLHYNLDTFDVATYELGEQSVAYMAAAALGALALGLTPEQITDGIANYEA